MATLFKLKHTPNEGTLINLDFVTSTTPFTDSIEFWFSDQDEPLIVSIKDYVEICKLCVNAD